MMSGTSDRLTAADFGGFFEEVHGYRPFPWQGELVQRVLADGWPGLVDVPTGLGKTAVLDAAVFLSALGSEHARRRVFLVVDRRVIVDQAHEEAEKIQRALTSPPPGSVRAAVARALAVPGDAEDGRSSPLDVTRMRGGVNWSWLWLERPDRHAIITGTVDQVGSRLLFRGYGVGERLRPIDAAMSASPGDRAGAVHGIGDADREHAVAGTRLRAAKSLHSVEVTATTTEARAAGAEALAYWARQLGGRGKVVGIVANTVTMARDAFERLRKQVGDGGRCVLLTGRVRPIDREYLLDEWYPVVRSGARRDPGAEVYVVATQTIEAGADIDLDGMVTQAASLPALVQRLGRLNRLGERDEARAIVIRCGRSDDPVYGEAAEATWAWLAGQTAPLAHKVGRSPRDLGAGLDVSPARLRDLVGGIPGPERARMRAVERYVPMLAAATLGAWARTSPAPHPDVPV